MPVRDSESGACLWIALQKGLDRPTWQEIRRNVASQLTDLEYRTRIESGEVWPGRTELDIAAKLYCRRIEVFVEKAIHLKRIACFGHPRMPDHPQRGSELRLVYSVNEQGFGHYEYLQRLDTPETEPAKELRIRTANISSFRRHGVCLLQEAEEDDIAILMISETRLLEEEMPEARSTARDFVM